MEKLIFVLKDKKSGFNSPLSLYDNEALALRDFQNACKVSNSLLANNPEDFCLCRVASFDTISGIVKPLKDVKVIAEATSFVIKEA